MMKDMTVKQASEEWAVSGAMVRRYCKEGKIPKAILTEEGWKIPKTAKKPNTPIAEEKANREPSPLAKKLINQKKKRNFHGLYDFTVIDLTYSSSRMASVRLTRQQVETIFKKGKVRESFEPLKVSDVIEVLNHIHCVDYILDHVMEPLTQKFIRKLHQILMTGTVDEYRGYVRPGR